MTNIQRGDAEKVNLIEEGNKIGINEAIKHNEIINNNLKYIYIYMCKYKMKSYCLKCRKDIENINPKVSKTSNGRTMLLSNCAICGDKKSRFIKNQNGRV